MSTRLTGRNPLAYLGVEALTPPNMITSPVSPTAESRNANVGDYWLNTTNSNLYILASLSDMIASWVLIHSTVSSIDFVTNSGTAIPSANIINLLGGTGITTSASGNTIDVILSTPVSIANGGTNATSMTNSNGVVYFNGTSLVTTTVGTAGQILTSQGVGMPPHFAANTASSTFNADSGSATPTAGVITMHGTGDITTSAAGSTVTFVGSGITTVNTGSGTATASSNAITIAGGTGIATTGAGSTVTIAATGALTQTFAADSGTATPSAGIITMHGGNNITTSASGSTVTYNVSGTTNNAVQVGNAGGSLTSLTVGTNGQVLLGSTAANPSFVTPTAGTGLSITTNASTLQYALSAPVTVTNGGTGDTSLTAYAVLCGGTTSTNPIQSVAGVGTSGQVLTSNGAGALPTFQTAASSITITGDSGGGLTGSSFTFTGGTTGLTFAGAGSTETLGGTLAVKNGGTGAITLTSHSLLLGNGTSAVSALGAATNGQLPIGNTGNAPSLATITAGSGISVTNGAGTITIAATGGSGISTINGNSGSVTGSTVTITTGTSNANGTSLFTGSGTTLTQTFDDANNNLGLGGTVFSSGSFTAAQGTAIGSNAGASITSGNSNSLYGYNAGTAITTGNRNCAFGNSSLNALTTGIFNACYGTSSGDAYTGAEKSNICINHTGVIGESNVLRLGLATGTGNQNLNSAFICGITGITVTGTAVLVSAGNQLGVAVSSKRFKSDIQDMNDGSSALYKLRPVSFVWNRNSAPGLKDATDLRQYGLIAEEAASIIPHAVNLDKEGQPLNINYQDLIGMMINEIQKLRKEIDALKKGEQ